MFDSLGMIFFALHSCDSNCLMDYGCFVCLHMQGIRKKGRIVSKPVLIKIHETFWQIKHCFIMHLRNLKKLVGIFRLNSYLCLGWNSSAVFCYSVEVSRDMQAGLRSCILFCANCCLYCFQEARKVYEMLVKNSTTASSLAYIQVSVLEGVHGYWKQLPN